jgi:hypothetical protein
VVDNTTHCFTPTEVFQHGNWNSGPINRPLQLFTTQQLQQFQVRDFRMIIMFPALKQYLEGGTLGTGNSTEKAVK